MLNEQHPNAYQDIVEAIWANRDQLGHARRILKDGCSLGTTDVYDWTTRAGISRSRGCAGVRN